MRLAPLSAVILSLAATVAAADPPENATIDDVAWMAGHWRLDQGTTIVEEGWFAPAGGSMVGVNRTVTGMVTTGFEFLLLRKTDSGIVLSASPNGRCPATEFALTEFEEQRAVFSNPEHDFPQRIIYRREGNRLHAEIEGTTDGEARKIGWVFELMP